MMLNIRKFWWLILIAIILLAYWLLPISGQVIVIPGTGDNLPWPQFRLDPPAPSPGSVATVVVTDIEPWAFVTLTVNGVPALSQGEAVRSGTTWTWRWTFTVPVEEASESGYEIMFYRDCHTGCVARGRFTVGEGMPQPASAATVPTKLGVVLANPSRDWHNRSGWVVEITYARKAEEFFWGVDDLAARVALHHAQG